MSSSLLQLVYRLSSELLVTLGADNGEGEDWLLGPASGGEDTLAIMAATKASERNSCSMVFATGN
jgi:hypothetical protein